jgi:hypothetical protein
VEETLDIRRNQSIRDAVKHSSRLLVEESADDEVATDVEDQDWDCDEGRKANSTVAVIHCIEWVENTYDCNLTKYYQHSPKASLPEDVSTSIDNNLADSTKTFAHEDVEQDFATEIED